MNFTFKKSPTFRKNFERLPQAQRDLADEKFKVFRKNPFDTSLGTHSIRRLSAIYKKTIYSVKLEGDLRVIFRIDGSTITSIDIGTHDIYG